MEALMNLGVSAWIWVCQTCDLSIRSRFLQENKRVQEQRKEYGEWRGEEKKVES